MRAYRRGEWGIVRDSGGQRDLEALVPVSTVGLLTALLKATISMAGRVEDRDPRSDCVGVIYEWLRSGKRSVHWQAAPHIDSGRRLRRNIHGIGVAEAAAPA